MKTTRSLTLMPLAVLIAFSLSAQCPDPQILQLRVGVVESQLAEISSKPGLVKLYHCPRQVGRLPRRHPQESGLSAWGIEDSNPQMSI